ncbi:hypothetical protein [Rhodococcus sp. MEB064]|uniref:hypothetical protein n=1 Tax=Rhodococcus sp. MEB064 TaxID=1587522 RepID=UPI0018CD231E|nr:hypothetical protein [Rhodococcus sp. MEB064]
MAGNTGERTLIPALIPPSVAHVDGISSLAVPESGESLLEVGAVLSSLTIDFLIRSAPKNDIRGSVIARLPMVTNWRIRRELRVRFLLLSVITEAYSAIWADVFRTDWNEMSIGSIPVTAASAWSTDTPLRVSRDRRQAHIEIDALVALGFGLTADELCTIYRTQFPVLYGYDRKTYLYDSNGRLVPQSVLVEWRKRGDSLTVDQRTAANASGNTYVYELPFQFLDRENDMREAYAEFERRFGIVGGTSPESWKSINAEGR